MKKTWLSLVTLGVLTMSAIAGCSKSNNVDTGDDVTMTGDQCSGAGDEGCGVGSVCVLGQCRHGCTNDAECPQGSICVGDRPPYGCTTEEESACASSDDCPNGLDCGLDGKCRHACQEATDCPRNEHHCIASTCVSEAEKDFEQWICDFDAFEEERYRRRVWYRDGMMGSCNIELPGENYIDTCNAEQFFGFATMVGPVDIANSSIVGSLSEEFPACIRPDCASGIHVCPVEKPCNGDVACEACTSAPFSEPFACRPSENSVLDQCACLDEELVLDCAGSEAIPQDAAVPPGVRNSALLQLVMREVQDCQLKIPDAIHYATGNGLYWPLATDQALVVSDQGPLVPGVDYELVDGVITFSAEACARTHLTTYVCKGSCAPPSASDPGTCTDIQET